MEKRVKGSQIIFRLTDKEAREFKAQCVLQGTSIQVVLEQAVKDFMQKAKKKAEQLPTLRKFQLNGSLTEVEFLLSDLYYITSSGLLF